jgi:hypothetical protein
MPNLGIKTYLEKYIRNVLKNREKLEELTISVKAKLC